MTETDYILQQRNSAADTTIKIRYIHSFKNSTLHGIPKPL